MGSLPVGTCRATPGFVGTAFVGTGFVGTGFVDGFLVAGLMATKRKRLGRAGFSSCALCWPEEEPYFFSSRAGEGSAAESVEFLPRDFLFPVVCVHPRICVGPWDGGGAVAE